MDTNELLRDLFSRLDDHLPKVVEGLDAEALRAVPEAGANSIGWLVWHLIRVQDHYVAELSGQRQLWETSDWAGRFGLEPDPRNSGYGHTPADVAAVRPDGPEALTGYYAAVAARMAAYLAQLPRHGPRPRRRPRLRPAGDLGARLVSIADDDLQHVGQAAYVRGLLERAADPSAGRPCTAEPDGDGLGARPGDSAELADQLLQ